MTTGIDQSDSGILHEPPRHVLRCGHVRTYTHAFGLADDSAEIMSEVCRFFLQGKCKFGDSCKNLHPGAGGGGGPGRGGGGGSGNREWLFEKQECIL